MRKSNTKEFIAKSKKFHKNKYNYSCVDYVDSKTKVKIICKKHTLFWQTPNDHLSGYGCPKCGGSIISNTKEFIEKSKKIQSNKYDYSKTIYKNNHTNVIIICKKHGEFLQNPNSHLHNHGCLICSNENKGNSQRSNNLEFVKKCKPIHDDLYSYSNVNYVNNKTKIEIICKKHGIFLQTPSDHLSGYGCPHCIHIISKSETNFLDYLRIPNTKENRQVCISQKRVDGFDKNTIYEFLGDYWHGNPEKFNCSDVNKHTKKSFGQLYSETFDKFQKLKSLNYNVKYIWESDWNKFARGYHITPNIQEV